MFERKTVQSIERELREAWSDAARAAALAARRTRAFNREQGHERLNWRDAMDRAFKKAGGRTSKRPFKPSNLRGMFDSIGKVPGSKGTYVGRSGYFYRHGRSAEGLATSLKKAYRKAKILDVGDHWAPFRGGSSLANSSHFYVKFKHPRRG